MPLATRDWILTQTDNRLGGTKLSLSGLNIDGIAPDACSIFKNVESIDLSNNSLTELPPGLFDNLINLREVNLSNNFIKSIGKALFARNVKLEGLNLSNNLLECIDYEAFGNSRLLQLLDISNNKLARLALILRMDNLKSLDISNNQIEELSPDFFVGNNSAGLPTLEVLRANNNRLKRLPKQLNMPALTLADFDNNPLEEIPQINSPYLEFTIVNGEVIKGPAYRSP